MGSAPQHMMALLDATHTPDPTADVFCATPMQHVAGTSLPRRSFIRCYHSIAIEIGRTRLVGAGSALRCKHNDHSTRNES